MAKSKTIYICKDSTGYEFWSKRPMSFNAKSNSFQDKNGYTDYEADDFIEWACDTNVNGILPGFLCPKKEGQIKKLKITVIE